MKIIPLTLDKPRYVYGVLSLAREMYEESGYLNIPYSENRTLTTLSNCARRGGAWLALDALKPVGFMAGEIVHYTFSEEKIAQDVAFYVHPRWRAKGAGGMLLSAFIEWAEGFSVREICVGLTHSNDPDTHRGAIKLMESSGFECVGQVFKLKRY